MGSSIPKNKVETPIPLEEAPPQKYKRLYANYIRAIAACAVVQMHSVGEYLFQFDPAAGNDIKFITADIFYSLLRWGTPFFVLVSGALLLKTSREESTRQFLGKRLRRVLIPLAFWGTVYLIYQYRANLYFGDPLPWDEIGRRVFFEDIHFHLWFIPMITGLYLLTPTLRILIRHATRADIEYFLALSFSITALQHYLPGFFLVKYIGWLGYVGFYVLGYYLSTYPISGRWKRVVYSLALLMPALTAYGTWWLSVKTGAYNDKVFVYASPNVVVMVFALFLFLKDVDWGAFATRYPRINLAVNRLAELSYGIYFIHVLVLDVLKNGYIGGWHIYTLRFFNYPVHPALGGVLQAITALAVSVAAILLLSRVPVVKKWLM